MKNLLFPIRKTKYFLYIPIYFFVFKAINKRLCKYGKEERTLYAPLDSFLHGAKRLQRFRTLGMPRQSFYFPNLIQRSISMLIFQ